MNVFHFFIHSRRIWSHSRRIEHILLWGQTLVHRHSLITFHRGRETSDSDWSCDSSAAETGSACSWSPEVSTVGIGDLWWPLVTSGDLRSTRCCCKLRFIETETHFFLFCFERSKILMKLENETNLLELKFFDIFGRKFTFYVHFLHQQETDFSLWFTFICRKIWKDISMSVFVADHWSRSSRPLNDHRWRKSPSSLLGVSLQGSTANPLPPSDSASSDSSDVTSSFIQKPLSE